MSRMTDERWVEVETGKATLTVEEQVDGYHFCPDWDFMLIGPDTPEAECCGCHIESCRPGGGR